MLWNVMQCNVMSCNADSDDDLDGGRLKQQNSPHSRCLLEGVATEQAFLIKMLYPGMVSPEWHSLARHCSGSFDDALVTTIGLQTNIFIVKTGPCFQLPRALQRNRLRIFDAQPFFRLPEEKTAYHIEVHLSFLGSGMFCLFVRSLNSLSVRVLFG